MIDKITKEKVKLTTREILLFLIDCLIGAGKPFDRHGMYRKTISDYFNWRELDRKRFSDNLKRLEKQRVIKIYLENNENILELTNKGKQKVMDLLTRENQKNIPEKWDCKWRIVIFDIPDEDKNERDAFRNRLKSIGFYQLQESVFIFPFDCKDYIDYLKELYQIEKYVQYVVAEAIDTQVDLLRRFIDLGIIKRKMLAKGKGKKHLLKFAPAKNNG